MTIPLIKVVLAISLDGRIGLGDGSPAALGGDGDRDNLEKSLAWADLVLIGGETLRAHKNICLLKKKNLIKRRVKEGRSEQPISLVVSNKVDFSIEWSFFNQPIERWLMSSSIEKYEKIRGGATSKGFTQFIPLQQSWKETLSQLSIKGIKRILLLGGALLIDSILKEDLIEELQLTITPKIIGGAKTWIPSTSSIIDFNPNSIITPKWKLKSSKKLDQNEIMVKYKRNRKVR